MNAADRPKYGTPEYKAWVARYTPGTPEYQQMIKEVVDKAPPFTEQQKRRLAVLLRPVDPKYRGKSAA